MVRLYRDMKLKAYFANVPLDEDEEFDKKIYIPSEWDPKHWMVPVEVTYRFHKLRRELEALFQKRRGTSNLLPIQRKSLHALRQQHSTIVVDCDKNLGPCLIDRETYITRTLAHLQDRHTYLPLTHIQVQQEVSRVQNNIKDWMKEHDRWLTRAEKKYLRHEPTTNLPIFYMTIKIHKTPWSLRPITACRNTLLHKLGVFVDRYLQRYAQAFPSYFKNSRELKDKLGTL